MSFAEEILLPDGKFSFLFPCVGIGVVGMFSLLTGGVVES